MTNLRAEFERSVNNMIKEPFYSENMRTVYYSYPKLHELAAFRMSTTLSDYQGIGLPVCVTDSDWMVRFVDNISNYLSLGVEPFTHHSLSIYRWCASPDYATAVSKKAQAIERALYLNTYTSVARLPLFDFSILFDVLHMLKASSKALLRPSERHSWANTSRGYYKPSDRLAEPMDNDRNYNSLVQLYSAYSFICANKRKLLKYYARHEMKRSMRLVYIVSDLDLSEVKINLEACTYGKRNYQSLLVDDKLLSVVVEDHIAVLCKHLDVAKYAIPYNPQFGSAYSNISDFIALVDAYKSSRSAVA